ncbi:sugar ABC transporter ATP-binding protein [Azospirillum thermophilum]|uniref:D-xylose ABC transporter ATP-binding protein n=1 Tax=Azospirillum thermophilum TaxID=2202148 RepID=A0A2S2CZE1_9PROT|nr:sugar ABC transporter ATP-binding protein [Azospirillum thermophilum]AWK89750.1 D-xylose ABC transporter ATP-binding protein [Azospirillum thermophilum]
MGQAILRAADIRKAFPGVVALDGVRMEVEPGEVHALLGENGAGKSTFLKILAGAQPCDGGELLFAGERLEPAETPIDRQNRGIVTIYQEFNLLPAMTIAENMYLGREPLRGNGLIDWRRMYRDARKVIDELGLGLDPRTPVRVLSVAEQQMVEISKALTMNARLIIMDEPTAALSGKEVDKLHSIIRDLKAKGIAIIYVTHRLVEVTAVCDRFTVFRDGRYVATRPVEGATVEDMVRLMVGRDVEFQRRRERYARDHVMLEVRGVSRAGRPGEPHATILRDLSVQVRAGEIVGFAGLVGAGRTELARIIFGADGCDSGLIAVDGKAVPLKSPGDALAAGIALVPEDRKQQGCFLPHSIRHNLSLPSLKRLSKWKFFVDEKAERQLIEDYRRKFGIKMANDEVAIGTLSGGNQQKVLLARCMALKPKVLIVDEPTRGIDVGAKAEVHQVLFEMARAGVAVIVISSELPEVMAVADRIVTFREGRITGSLDADEATEERLMSLMALGAGPGGTVRHIHAAH